MKARIQKDEQKEEEKKKRKRKQGLKSFYGAIFAKI